MIKKTAILNCIFVFFSITRLIAQDKHNEPTYTYSGYITVNQKTRVQIDMNFLILSDSTIAGSYYYAKQDGDLSLSGRLYANNRFFLTERDKNGVVTGSFRGILTKGYDRAYGKWMSSKTNKIFDFLLAKEEKKSYWYYIRKKRTLFEYTNFNKAINQKEKVLLIDVASMNLNKIPKQLSTLNKIISINLLGNQFTSFPTVLSHLNSLEEISMPSNKLKYVGPEIGRLRNLRILIMNFNQLTSLPKEIGNLKKLLYLELGRNKLTSLPVEIKQLTNLQELHIENNALSEIEKQKIRQALPNCLIHF